MRKVGVLPVRSYPSGCQLSCHLKYSCLLLVWNTRLLVLNSQTSLLTRSANHSTVMLAGMFCFSCYNHYTCGGIHSKTIKKVFILIALQRHTAMGSKSVISYESVVRNLGILYLSFWSDFSLISIVDDLNPPLFLISCSCSGLNLQTNDQVMFQI